MALPGVLLIAVVLLVNVVIPLLTGTLSEGETPFSVLIELPFWMGVLIVWTFPPAIVGWLVARTIGTGLARRQSP